MFAYTTLKRSIESRLSGHTVVPSFTVIQNHNFIRCVRISQCVDLAVVQISVTVDSDFTPQIKVHNVMLDSDHPFWEQLPQKVNSVEDFVRILTKLETYQICQGNFENHFQHLLLEGIPLAKGELKSEYSGFKEGDFGELVDSKRITSTLWSMKCALIHRDSPRCQACTKHRSTLNGMLRRQKERKSLTSENILTSTKPVRHMTQQEISTMKHFCTKI